MVDHRNITSSTAARNVYYPIRRDDQFLLLSSFAFDSSLAGIFGTLTTGGCLHMPDQESGQDPQTIGRLLCQQKISRLLCVPSFAQMLLPYLESGGAGALRELIMAGEPCPSSLPQEVHLLHRDTIVFNEYGPTEAAVWATVYRCKPDAADPIPIGRPIANTRIYILDSQREPLPVGVEGDLYIGGAGVARGYLNQAALTRQRFSASPFVVGDRLYRTGDRARFLADGNIQFLGRDDSQIKIRGFRVELGEIESQLRECLGVSESVVVVRKDSLGEMQIVAYVVQNSEPVATVIELLQRLRSGLPEHMLPAAIVTLERLPLTPNGKIDRKALPAPDMQAYASREYEAPSGEVEQVVARIWQDLLRIERIGRQDNFFDLGGHSISAMQLMTRLRSLLSVEIPLQAIFSSPVMSEFAIQVATFRREKSELEENDSLDTNYLEDLRERVASMPEARVRELLRELEMRGQP